MAIHVTVAAIIEKNGHFLMVEETDPLKGRVLNQPAGHLEEGESLLEAIRREVLEETGYAFDPEYLIGAYLLKARDHDATYLRFCFAGQTGERLSHQLDPDIVDIHWLEPQAIGQSQLPHRSVLVTRALNDYLQGKRFSTDALVYLGNERHLHTCCDILPPNFDV